MPSPEDYSTHKEQLEHASPPPDRAPAVEAALVEAFGPHIELLSGPHIQFDQVSVTELATALYRHPIILKPLLAAVNAASRAIKRDLQIDIDTYADAIDPTTAGALAGYLTPMLPPTLPVASLVELDRFFWTDKELRASKGRWEEQVAASLQQHATVPFRKRKFVASGQKFEIDQAYPAKGPIEVAIDIKRIESPRDIHKRSDEIVNKASKLKSVYPEAVFFAVIYYPFPSQHANVSSRLQTPFIKGVFFAAETDLSIEQAMRLLLGKAGLGTARDTSPKGVS